MLGMFVIALSGCATHYSADPGSDPYGFFAGLWHGVIFPFSLLTNIVSWLLSLVGISLLESIQIVGRPNTGFWYYAGFFFGVAGIGGGSSTR